MHDVETFIEQFVWMVLGPDDVEYDRDDGCHMVPYARHMSVNPLALADRDPLAKLLKQRREGHRPA